MIYFVRHGETKLNALKIVQGTIDEPLNEQGKKQAEEIKEKLKKVDFDVVYSSPLKRALQTAQIINKGKIIVDNRLKEQYGGARQGVRYDAWDEIKIKDYKLHPQKYGAESKEDFYNRVLEFYKEIENSNKNILIVSHYGVHEVLRKYLDKGENAAISNCEAIILK